MPTVVIVGGGGREHALAHALARSEHQPQIIVAPGNGGITAPWRREPASGIDEWVDLAKTSRADLVVVGPEVPLVAGLADRLRALDIAVLGPSAAGAELEGSKAFAKEVMTSTGIPTAEWAAFDRPGPAIDFARRLPGAVVKADGLAAGKGVVVADDVATAEAAIEACFEGAFGSAGQRVVVEERLWGEELSVMALTDGRALALLAPSQDHKRVGEGDRGPNTGGMGAYSPPPSATESLLSEVRERCLQPVVDELARRGRDFSGVLYAGLMLTASGPKVLEYNVRFGDPEAQCVLPRLGTDAYDLFVAAARGRLDPSTVRFSSEAAMTVVLASQDYPASPRVGDRIEGLEDAEGRPGVTVFHAGTRRDGDAVYTAGGRVLGVTGQGADLATAAARAYEGVAAIRYSGMHYRRDIGFRALDTTAGR